MVLVITLKPPPEAAGSSCFVVLVLGSISIELISFRDNHALLSGGGIAMIDGTVGTTLRLEGVNLVRNSARRYAASHCLEFNIIIFNL